MSSSTYETTFERDDGSEVTVGYTISPYDPGVLSGPPEDCYPPEGGDAEILYALDPDGSHVEWTDEEDEQWRSWVEQNHEWDEGPDPDDERDRATDERMTED